MKLQNSTISKKLIVTVILLVLTLLLSNTVLGGGLYLESEFGTPSMGAAGAGAEAEAWDASTSWHNPAGMTRIDGSELMLTGGLGYSRVKFDRDFVFPAITGGDGGNAGGYFPLGGLFYVHSLSEDWKFGLSVYSTSGAALDYDDEWAGRFLVQDVTIFTATIAPSLAYRINDELSVAGTFGAVYGDIEYDLFIPGVGGLPGPTTATLDGDDWQYGYGFSTLYEISETTRVGALYWSEVEFEFSGDLDVTGVGGVGSDLDLPLAQFVRGGVYHQLDEKWALVGTVAWEDWSTMDNILISTDGGGGASLSRNWSDTFHYAGGVHYRPKDKWLIRAGVGYDTNPVDSTDRTPDMPIDRQVRYATGVQYEYSETLTLGASFEYIDLGSAKINRPLFKGEYEDNDMYVAGVFANWKF
ncbi:MAG: OmpP1/FadL family transporter [Planctomycetota bacterium]|jgi:long-chain fatty acid transport protein